MQLSLGFVLCCKIFTMLTRYFLGFIIFISGLCLQAQTGRIAGIITDAKTGETLPGATAMIEGTTKGASADFDGKFSINNIPVGKVNVIISYISYTTKKITDVQVKAGDETFINILLDPSTSQDLAEVEVVVTLNKENNTALVLQQKNNASVSDGVSAESIKRTPDRNTGDVLKRISGATIQDGKYAIIRGLSDRYNAAYLNGSPLPSTESDRKSFSFDIFPSNMLDNLVIYKTARPDLPGDFAGGVIEITTKSIPEKNFVLVSTGLGYNRITTGQERLFLNKGKTDWLGLDDGTRQLDKNLPGSTDFSVDSKVQANYAKTINTGRWGAQSDKFAPNSSYQLSAGYNFKLKERDFFGVLGSLSYNNTNNYFTTTRIEYDPATIPNDPINPLAPERDFTDATYQNQKLVAALLNLSCKINTNNSISSKNMYSINTDDRTIKRTGIINLVSDRENPDSLRAFAYWYTQNTILSNQLIGEHFIPAAKIKISWNGSLTNVKRIIPDLKRTIYTRKQKLLNKQTDPSEPPFFDSTDIKYQAIVPLAGTSGPDYSGILVSSSLEEKLRSFKGDISRLFKLTNDLSIESKIGAFAQTRNRTFELRQFTYARHTIGGNNNSFNSPILLQEPTQLYSSANMGEVAPGVGGLKLVEANNFDQSLYNASSELRAYYGMLDIRYKTWFKLVGGLRYESYLQKLSHPGILYYFDEKLVNYDTLVNDFLPSANLIFSLNDKQNIRLSYSKTVNRPEFREIAPLLFYDFNINFNITGNTALRRSTIQNYDFRYEIFPGAGQLASVSLFYKDFKDPIELIHSNNPREITYANSNRGTTRGIELEYRLNLGILTKQDSSFVGRLLNNLTVFSNFAYIRSEVDIVSNVPSTKGQKLGTRQMQGQSPYIINGGLSYIDSKYNYSFSVSYNRFGPRIYIVGNTTDATPIGFQTLWEKGRNVVDLQFTKSLFKNRFEIRYNIRDVLAAWQPQPFYQEWDGKVGFDKQKDAPIWSTQFATSHSIQLSYRF